MLVGKLQSVLGSEFYLQPRCAAALCPARGFCTEFTEWSKHLALQDVPAHQTVPGPSSAPHGSLFLVPWQHQPSKSPCTLRPGRMDQWDESSDAHKRTGGSTVPEGPEAPCQGLCFPIGMACSHIRRGKTWNAACAVDTAALQFSEGTWWLRCWWDNLGWAALGEGGTAPVLGNGAQGDPKA